MSEKLSKAIQKQIKDEYVTNPEINTGMKEMETTLPEVEAVFKNLTLEILDKPNDMWYSGFTWKLRWKKPAKKTLIFDILYSDRRFSIYVYLAKDIEDYPKELGHYHKSDLPKIHLKDFADWLKLEKLESYLKSFLHLFS